MSTPILLLAPGDRIPNFSLPAADGAVRMFYLDVSGLPAVLFVLASVRGRDPERGLAEIATRAADLRAAGAEVFAMVGDDAATAAATAERLGIDFPFYADARGAVLPLLLAPAAARAPRPPKAPGARRAEARAAPGTPYRTFVLDSNQRILEVIEPGGAERHAGRALETLRRWQTRQPEAQVLTSGAPVLFVPNVFDSGFCDRLIDVWRRKGHEEGGDAGGYGAGISQTGKQTLDHIITDPPLNDQICETFMRRIAPELTKAYGDLTERYYFDRHVIISYEAERQDFFGAHRDNFTKETRNRTFAVSLNLNEDYEGGELRFPEYGRHCYRPPAGTACVFSCSLLHEALPVTRGQRWVLTSFFWR